MQNTIYGGVLINVYVTNGNMVPDVYFTMENQSVSLTPADGITELTRKINSNNTNIESITVLSQPSDSLATSLISKNTPKCSSNTVQREQKIRAALSTGLPLGILLIGLMILLVFCYVRHLYPVDYNPNKFQKSLLKTDNRRANRPKLTNVQNTADSRNDRHIDSRFSKKEMAMPHVKTPMYATHAASNIENDEIIKNSLYSAPLNVDDLLEFRCKSHWKYESPLSQWFLNKPIQLTPKKKNILHNGAKSEIGFSNPKHTTPCCSRLFHNNPDSTSLITYSPTNPQSPCQKHPLIYNVIEPFVPRLSDEIELSLGEQVRLLAKHSDGWCLVEKCHVNNDIEVPDTNSVSDANYLNENRGIVPAMCLKN